VTHSEKEIQRENKRVSFKYLKQCGMNEVDLLSAASGFQTRELLLFRRHCCNLLGRLLDWQSAAGEKRAIKTRVRCEKNSTCRQQRRRTEGVEEHGTATQAFFDLQQLQLHPRAEF
jgi:hypothetical protein